MSEKRETIQSLRSVWTNPVHFLAFGFGSGLLPLMPGTFGTLIAIPLYLLLQDLSFLGYAITVLLLTGLGVWICHVTARDLGVHDYRGIVWDEIVGYLWTMLLVPPHVIWIVLGFIFFRLFDIWKPWPIGLIDRSLKGGAGIVADDVLAGIYACIALQMIIYLSSHF